MKGQNKYNNDNSGGMQGHGSWNDPAYDLQLTAEDTTLLEKINTYFKGYFDIEDVKSDPAYSKTRNMVKLMISDYQNNAVHTKDTEKFIRESMTREVSEAKLKKEISQIKQEINYNKLNDISTEWVKEWHEKKLKDGEKNKETEEIREFISSSLEPAKSRVHINTIAVKGKAGSGRIRIISYTSLAAAVIIGALLLIRSLLPFYNPDKIFSKYYKQYYAVSTVTRSSDTGGNERFTSALESYKNGNYQVAAKGFSEAMLKEAASISNRFFLGITQIAMNDFDQAINLLDGVANQQGEYSKEARWYLGLVYIKTGNKAKASECFKILAQTPGYYRERSEKILRRLK